jgi:D-alanine--poly(phosphoribitol) ligase subunit 1
VNILETIISSFKIFETNAALCNSNQFTTYHEFEQKITAISQEVKKFDAGSRIGVITYDDAETYASVFGIWYASCVFIPIHPDSPADRNNLILEQANMSAILTSKPDSLAEVLHCPENIEIINSNKLFSEKTTLTLPKVSENDIAYILFTSGSTGIPKGVPITHGNLNAFIDAFFALGYQIDSNDRVLQMFDMTFDLSLMSYIVPLLRGACVYTVPPGSIKYTAIYDIFEEHEITVALMVPSILSYLRPYFSEIQLPKMRYSLFCGEALYEDITEEWAKCVPNAIIHNVYGPTEATIFCLTYLCGNSEGKEKAFNGILSIGKPMLNMDAIIVDENLNPLPDGEKGELCLMGAQMTPGYWKNPEKNQSAFFTLTYKEKPCTFYRTGDLCFKDDEGDFLFCGRIDFQVKIQGFRVELSEIEHHVREFTGLSNIVAIAYQNEIGNTQIHLFLEKFPAETSSVMNFLKAKLPPYMIPSEITVLPIFPLNANGKVDRKALKATLEIKNKS